MMQWLKMGRIFDPHRFSPPLSSEGYAQAPQALVLRDRVRVYFCSRRRDKSGKFLSYVLYADFSLDFSEVLVMSQSPVLPLGRRGTFDEHGVFPLHVVAHEDRVLGYISGVNRRTSVPADGAIGLALSRDGGSTFQRLGDGPVLAPSLYAPCIAVDPCVRVVEGVYHMWFVFGLRWNKPTDHPERDRVYKIGHATSADGVSWEPESGAQSIQDLLGPDECQAMPTVLRLADGYWHMLFCYRHASGFRGDRGRAYRIGHARSTDLVNWDRDDSDLTIEPGPDAWDEDMVCYPHMVRVGEEVYLLYNGNHFGRDGFGLAKLQCWAR
jgi:hypothetical protein